MARKRKNILSRRTIARDLALWLSLTVAAIITLLAASYSLYSSNKLHQELREKADYLTRQFTEVITLPLFNLNTSTINHISSVYLDNNYVAGICIETDFGEVIFKHLPEVEQLIVKRQATLHKDSMKLGTVDLYFTGLPLRERQQVVFKALIILALVVITVIVSGTYLFMHFFLVKPVNQLNRGIREIASGNYKKPLSMVPQQDISAIIREINTMAENITSKTEALSESERKYRALFDGAIEGIFQTTSDGQKFITANPSLAEIFGYDSPAEMLSSISDITQQVYVNPDEALQIVSKLKQQKQVTKFETQVYRKDRSVIWISLNIRAVRDNRGSISHLEGRVVDITERKEAEKELIRLASVIEQTDEEILITDSKGNIQYVNPSFERITGYSRTEMLGKNPRILKSGKQDSEFYKNIWDTITRGHIWKGILFNRKKDGTLFEEEATIPLF